MAADHRGKVIELTGRCQDEFHFTGTLKRVTFDLSGDLIIGSTDLKVAMARR